MIALDDDKLPIIRSVHINVPWKFIPRYIDMIIDHRLNVEIGFEAAELDQVNRSEFKAIAKRLQKLSCGITLHAPFWDLAPGSLDPLIRQVTSLRLHQFFDLVSIFEPVQIVCHTGYDPSHHQGQTEFWLDKSLALWEPLIIRAENSKVPILLENVWENDPGFHLGLLRQIDSPWFGFCLDVGHQNSFSETDLQTWVRSLADYLRELHLHDNDGTCDAHLPIGQGNIDFLFLFEFLQNRGIKPLLTLEPHTEEHLQESIEGLHFVLSQMTLEPAPVPMGKYERNALWP